MSIFDFPRINIKGLVQINVGTGNNDDYSLNAASNATPTQPATFSGYCLPAGSNSQIGQPLRLANSETVQPYTFNVPGTSQPMTDGQMVNWIQQGQNMQWYNNAATSTQVSMIPGEWNYYGSMGMNMMSTSVIGVTVPDASASSGTKVYTSNDPLNILGGSLSFNNSAGRSTAMLIDVNPEAPPASQVFTDNLCLMDGQGNVIFNAKPSKASTRWINFQRNTYLNQSNGAGGTFQCAIPLSQLAGQPIVEMMSKYPATGKTLIGVVFRYTLFRSLQEYNYWNGNSDVNPPAWNKQATGTYDWNQKMESIYKQQGSNPTYVQISGTIAPWYEGELESMVTGSFLAPSEDNSFVSPGGNTGPPPNNMFGLAPAMINRNNGTVLSLDLSAALPDAYSDLTNQFNPMITNNNPKFTGFGTLQFGTYVNNEFNPLGNINYTNTNECDAAGWIFDFNPMRTKQTPVYALYAQNTVQAPNQKTPVPGVLLMEQEEYFISDQPGVYAEQGYTPTNPNWLANMPPLPMTTSIFSSQGYQDTRISFNKYSWGLLDNTGDYVIWMMNMTYIPPTQSGQGSATPVVIMQHYTPGSAITVPTDQAGVFIITITNQSATASDVSNMINNSMMTAPMINCRILPNNPANNPGNADYSQYYTFDSNGNPVFTNALYWNVLYEQVFRNYYLLYPAMSIYVALNDPNQWIGPTLNTLLERVNTSAWNTPYNMPRTRDLSATKRWLIQAYCNRFVTQSPPANNPPQP